MVNCTQILNHKVKLINENRKLDFDLMNRYNFDKIHCSM